jgi:hypothetical protein
MAVEVTLVLRFEESPPPDFERDVEDEYDCIVVECEEQEV